MGMSDARYVVRVDGAYEMSLTASGPTEALKKAIVNCGQSRASFTILCPSGHLAYGRLSRWSPRGEIDLIGDGSWRKVKWD